MTWVELIVVDVALLRRWDRNFLVITGASILENGLQVIFLRDQESQRVLPKGERSGVCVDGSHVKTVVNHVMSYKRVDNDSPSPQPGRHRSRSECPEQVLHTQKGRFGPP